MLYSVHYSIIPDIASVFSYFSCFVPHYQLTYLSRLYIPLSVSSFLNFSAESFFNRLEKQYADFGSDIQHFAGNLKKLGMVIQDVTKQVPASLSPQDHDWNLESLLQICGNFRKTLHDCERLLNDQTKFGRGRGGFIYNIQWNYSIEPEVTQLKDRVAFHNIKVPSEWSSLTLRA